MTHGIGTRLRGAREAAGLSRKQAAQRLGFANESAVQHHENDTNKLRPEALQAYSDMYKVSIDWLVTSYGKGPGSRVYGVPIVGKIGAGAAIYPIDDAGYEEIEPPPNCPPGALAFRVEGDSQYPAYSDGDIVIALPCADIHDILNRDAVVTLDDQRRLLKRVAPGSAPGMFYLSSHNAPPIHDVRIVSFMRVKYIVRP
jgi:transcriptional regulator with XRE-family HTH domain